MITGEHGRHGHFVYHVLEAGPGRVSIGADQSAIEQFAGAVGVADQRADYEGGHGQVMAVAQQDLGHARQRARRVC